MPFRARDPALTMRPHPRALPPLVCQRARWADAEGKDFWELVRWYRAVDGALEVLGKLPCVETW